MKINSVTVVAMYIVALYAISTSYIASAFVLDSSTGPNDLHNDTLSSSSSSSGSWSNDGELIMTAPLSIYNLFSVGMLCIVGLFAM